MLDAFQLYYKHILQENVCKVFSNSLAFVGDRQGRFRNLEDRSQYLFS